MPGIAFQAEGPVWENARPSLSRGKAFQHEPKDNVREMDTFIRISASRFSSRPISGSVDRGNLGDVGGFLITSFGDSITAGWLVLSPRRQTAATALEIRIGAAYSHRSLHHWSYLRPRNGDIRVAVSQTPNSIHKQLDNFVNTTDDSKARSILLTCFATACARKVFFL